MTDPRRSSAYVMARRRFINQHEPGHPCTLCGLPIDTRLSGNEPFGPSIEHTVPVRSSPELALDERFWRLCHRRCNDAQGARVTNALRRMKRGGSYRRPERDW